MAKLYWADHKDSESWCGPHADIEECKRVARIVHGEDGGEIWVAPCDADSARCRDGLREASRTELRRAAARITHCRMED